jgi:hypothetical protein
MDRSVTLAALCMSLALFAMLVAVIRPTPVTIGLFLGIGPVAALVSLALFVRTVLRDLRSRRAL